MAVEASLLKRLKLRSDYDGAQDYDLVLRVVDSLWQEGIPASQAARICHIPKVLYHWRSHRDSTALNTGSKTYAYEAGRRALADFCAGRGLRVQVEHSLHLGFYRIVYESDLPDARQDVGMLGGRILDGKTRIFAGGYDEEGSCLYEGLPARFTGGVRILPCCGRTVPPWISAVCGCGRNYSRYILRSRGCPIGRSTCG